MIRRPPRSTLDRSSAASDVYKRQRFARPFIDGQRFIGQAVVGNRNGDDCLQWVAPAQFDVVDRAFGDQGIGQILGGCVQIVACLTFNEVGAWPVSYTHLRAHETVLDLVCRLLLEKKKKVPDHVCRSLLGNKTHETAYIINRSQLYDINQHNS